MKLESYWLDTSPAFKGGVQGDVSGRADVVVIGGGFTGLSAALALARRKASVVVLEASRVLGEASGRNGGQCNNGLAHDYAGLVQRLGAELARALYLAFNAAVDTVERLIHEEKIACDFARRGKLKLAVKPEHFATFAKAYDRLRVDVDPYITLVPPDGLGAEIGSDVFHGGLVHPASAQLHPGKFGIGLADAAVRKGARIYESAAVTALERLSGSAYRVTSERGTIQAVQVLLATGCTRLGPFPWFRRRIIPVGSFIVVTEPLTPSVLDRVLPTRRGYVTSANIGNYFRATPDSRLLFGGRARFAMSNPRSDQKSGEILRVELGRIFPELRDVRIDYCWGGLVDITADRLPRAGEHAGMFYATGFSGHGVQMSAHMGQIMADVMAGNRDANPLRDLSWPSILGYFGTPWFLPIIGAYYRVQDILH